MPPGSSRQSIVQQLDRWKDLPMVRSVKEVGECNHEEFSRSLHYPYHHHRQCFTWIRFWPLILGKLVSSRSSMLGSIVWIALLVFGEFVECAFFFWVVFTFIVHVYICLSTASINSSITLVFYPSNIKYDIEHNFRFSVIYLPTNDTSFLTYKFCVYFMPTSYAWSELCRIIFRTISTQSITSHLASKHQREQSAAQPLKKTL